MAAVTPVSLRQLKISLQSKKFLSTSSSVSRISSDISKRMSRWYGLLKRKAERVSDSYTYRLLLFEGSPEKYFKKLVGRVDLEGALKRLDKLTHDETRMATTQVLKDTYNVMRV